MSSAFKVLRGIEELYPEIPLIERARHCIEKFPSQNWEDVFSRGQVRSKQWLIQELIATKTVNLGTTVVCGGWVGLLSRMLLDEPALFTDLVFSLDLDGVCTQVADQLNHQYVMDAKFKAHTTDMLVWDYSKALTVINTSCEHMKPVDFEEWWNVLPPGMMVVLQSNDLEHDDHYNCVKSVDDMLTMAPMQAVRYAGKLPLFGYTRFMVIGTK